MKTITVQDSTWKRLSELKIEKDFSTLYLLINDLIKTYESKQ